MSSRVRRRGHARARPALQLGRLPCDDIPEEIHECGDFEGGACSNSSSENANKRQHLDAARSLLHQPRARPHAGPVTNAAAAGARSPSGRAVHDDRHVAGNRPERIDSMIYALWAFTAASTRLRGSSCVSARPFRCASGIGRDVPVFLLRSASRCAHAGCDAAFLGELVTTLTSSVRRSRAAAELECG